MFIKTRNIDDIPSSIWFNSEAITSFYRREVQFKKDSYKEKQPGNTVVQTIHAMSFSILDYPERILDLIEAKGSFTFIQLTDVEDGTKYFINYNRILYFIKHPFKHHTDLYLDTNGTNHFLCKEKPEEIVDLIRKSISDREKIGKVNNVLHNE